MTCPATLPAGVVFLAHILLMFLLGSWVLLPTAANGETGRTIAAVLRAEGPLLVLDCGQGRPHRALADKVADDLGPLRVQAIDRGGCDTPLEPGWDDSNLVILASSTDPPPVMAVATGLGLSVTADSMALAGMELRGEHAAAAVVLPHPVREDRWALLLVGTGAAALRGLDRFIRNDIAASVLAIDGEGERLATLIRTDQGWRLPAGHPYRIETSVTRFQEWRKATGARVAGWELDVTVDETRSELLVDARVQLTGEGKRGRPRSTTEVWLQLSPRAQVLACDAGGASRAPSTVVPFDARDGRILLEIVHPRPSSVVHLVYRIPLEGRLDAWYLGSGEGYVMAEANWFPRIVGAADEPYLARGELAVTLDAGQGVQLAGAGKRGILRSSVPRTPLLVWGSWKQVPLDGGTALLAAGAPAEVEQRAGGLLAELVKLLPIAPTQLLLVACGRPSPWYGDGVVLAPPDLLEPGAVDEVDVWKLERLLTEELIRLSEPRGAAVQIRGQVMIPTEFGPGVTVRLWRLRGSWWQEIAEGPVDDQGRFELDARGRGELLVTAEADGYLPAAVVVPLDGKHGSATLTLLPLREVSLLCLRCGPEMRPQRFPMQEGEPGRFTATLALGPLHRQFGSFPYAYELGPGGGSTILALDPQRPFDQFPSFLEPEEFHSEQVEFELRADNLRFWIEVPGALLAPQNWLLDDVGARP